MAPSRLQILMEGIRTASGLLYPSSCAVCKTFLGFKTGFALCTGCEAKIHVNHPPFCAKCGRHRPAEETACGHCAGEPQTVLDDVFFVYHYTGAAKTIIFKFKINGANFTRPIIRKSFRQFLKEVPSLKANYDCLVPIPSHKRSLSDRHLSSAELALVLGDLCSKRVLPLVRRERTVVKQTTLSKEKRWTNPAESFGIRFRGSLPASVLLVDDVITTGATADACARELKAAGVKRVGIFALARG